MSSPTPISDWQEDLQPVLERLEIIRRRSEKTLSNIGTGISVLAFITTVLICPHLDISYSSTPLIFVAPGMIGGIIYFALSESASANNRRIFRRRVLPRLVAECAMEFGGELEYSRQPVPAPDLSTPTGFLLKPLLQQRAYTNAVLGRIGATKVQFSGCHLSHDPVHDGNRTNIQNYCPAGFFLIFTADFNKHFQGETLILPDYTNKVLNRLAQPVPGFGPTEMFPGRPLVQLEDSQFEREFAVYSSDSVEAHYILSPSLMQRLVELRASCQANIRITFVNNQISVAVPLKDAWLEPPEWNIPVTMDWLEQCLEQLRLACSIVDALDLNTRIWSK